MEPTFSIEFDEPYYVPGNCVRGNLTIRNQSAIHALSLKICIHGEIQTYWTQLEKKRHLKSGHPVSHCHHHTKPPENKTFKSHINILEGVSQPWSSIDNPSNRIPIGVNIFPFVFQLPFSCPPSFEGTHGRVRYTVHVELNRPWRLDVEARRAFTVLPIIDLTTIPKIRNPVMNHACKHSGFLGSKEVKIKAQLPKSGFVPGEIIPIAISIHNHTKKPLYYLKAQLIQHVHYQAQQENSHFSSDEHCHKHCDHKTAETKMSEVEKSFEVNCCSEGIIQVALVLPNPLVPSFKTNIIEVDYCVTVEVEKDKKLRVEFPIIVGTSPVGHVMGSANIGNRSSALSVTQPDLNLLIEPPPEYQDRVEVTMASAPPPEYNENSNGITSVWI
ncbi:hypothetical protein B9Z55_004034 [Caenorhabditis nigoni]|uniref:Arrestin C-terminal-like domain-containing protein n=1 Tax=Caenorhabditis nigoni TaxID=1611254 RepID=A0A2G5UVH7_9PELO|nr:hypothetical protein B9Z55_004034 [Caenorhabditis nigoni]